MIVRMLIPTTSTLSEALPSRRQSASIDEGINFRCGGQDLHALNSTKLAVPGRSTGVVWYSVADLDHDLSPGHRDDSARHIATEIGREEYVSPCKFRWLSGTADQRLLAERCRLFGWHR